MTNTGRSRHADLELGSKPARLTEKFRSHREGRENEKKAHAEYPTRDVVTTPYNDARTDADAFVTCPETGLKRTRAR